MLSYHASLRIVSVEEILKSAENFSYILAPQGLTDGMKVVNGPEAEVKIGNCIPLENIPVGTQVHNIGAGLPHGVHGPERPTGALPSPPPCGWSFGFITVMEESMCLYISLKIWLDINSVSS